jgi:hypothetical protein
LFVGVDNKPVSGIALELSSGGQALHGRTAADGLARFEGLTGSAFQLCPYELDKDAWKVLRKEPLEPEHVITSGPASWESPVPPLTDANGTMHTVAAGESVDLLAVQNGLFADTVWSHARNRQLHNQRESRNVLYQGDTLFIPPITRQQVNAQIAMRHILQRQGVPSLVRLRLLDDLKPLADTAWTLEIEGEATLEGKTDSQGTLEVYVPATATEGALTFVSRGEQRQVKIGLGSLAPVHKTQGWRQRMRNLGFNCDAEEASEISVNDTGALLRFQESWGLPLTGKPDSATVEKIYSVHDGAPAEAPMDGLYSSATK